MQVVIDTNILVSSLLKANSLPDQVVSLWRSGKIELLISPDILVEVTRVLKYGRISKKVSQEEAKRFINLLETLATVVTPKEEVTVVEDDPDDDKFLSLALECGAKYIISGDTHLLRIESYQDVRIISAAQFLEVISPPTTE